MTDMTNQFQHIPSLNPESGLVVLNRFSEQPMAQVRANTQEMLFAILETDGELVSS